jgi:PAS domain S-box-containing protein
MQENHRKHILLVERGGPSAAALARELELLGYQVTAVSTAQEVDLAAGANPPDLALVDIDLCRDHNFQTALGRLDLPIVCLASRLDREIVDRIRAVTRYGFAARDSHPLQIQSAIQAALDLFAAHRLLAADQHSFQSLVENLPVEIYRTDAQGNSIFVNRYWRQVTGLAADEYQGLGWLQSVHPDDREWVAEGWRRIFQSGAGGELEYRCLHAGGTIWVLDQAVPEYGADGRLIGFVGVSTDITRRKQAEQALQESERHFRELFETSRDGINYADLQGRYVSANQAFLDLVGIASLEELQTKTYMDLTSPEYRRLEESSNREQLRVRGYSDEYEKEYIHKSGERIPVSLRVWNRYDAKGRLVGDWAMVRDIRERRQAEQALQESERQFRELFETSRDGINFTDVQGHYISANLAFLEMLGLSSLEELREKTYLDLTPPEYWEQEEHIFRTQTLVRGYCDEYEKEYYHKSGERVPVRLRVWNRYSTSGELMGQWAIVQDIRLRKQAERALRESEHQFRDLFESSRDGIAFTDHQRRFTAANQAYLDLLGLSTLDELRGKTYFDLTPPEYWPLEEQIYRDQVNQRGYSDEFEKEYFHASGERIPVSLRVWQRRTPDGQVEGEWAVVRDIRERKRADREIRRLLDEKDMLLHEVHHRIKNNMNTISSLLSLQADYLDDPLAITALGEASGRVHSMMMIYDTLYRSGDFQQVDLQVFLSCVVEDLAVAWRLPGRDIQVLQRIEPIYLPTAQSMPLGIVVNELVTNAFKYAFSEKTEGQVSVAAWQEDGTLHVEVADDGVGLPADVDFTTSESFGLSLVRVLITQLKGSLRVERSRGTTFHLAVPR